MTEPIRVLHIDDEPGFADLTADFLRRENDQFEVITETDPQDTLETVQKREFDCIVSDHNMPEMSGIELLESIRDEYPTLPVILFTGKGSEEVASKAVSAGATDYLQKERGVDQYTLLANRIENAVDQYRTTQRAIDLDRLRTVSRAVNQKLVRASSREEADKDICTVLTDTEQYTLAWIGDLDRSTGEIYPRSVAGVGKEHVQEITITIENETGEDSVSRAVRDNCVVVSEHISVDSTSAPWEEKALNRGLHSFAVVPLEHNETWYGVLFLYSESKHPFDEAEIDLLEELGEDIAQTYHSLDLQEQIRLERDRHRELFENAPGAIAISDSVEANQVIRDVNDAFEETFEYERNDIIGKTFTEALIPDDRDQIERAVRRCMEEGEPFDMGCRILTTQQRERWVRVAGEPVIEDGEITHVRGAIQDLTGQKERELHLQRQERRYEAVFNDPNILVALLDTDGSLLDVNQTAIEYIDISKDDLSDQFLWDTPWFQHSDAIQKRLKDRIERAAAGEYVEFEGERVRPDGTPYTVEGVLRPVTDAAGTVVSILISSRDITQRKKREQRLQEFASVVSHDLRNPLNVAKGYAELANRECDSEAIEHIVDALDRMGTLIEDLLTLADSGADIGDTERVDLGVLVKQSWENVETADATLRGTTDQVLFADRSRLKQLLENVIRNAIKHGGSVSTVTVGALDSGFFIEDDGIGIPDDQREKVFEPGYTTADDGSGLGLRIIQQIVDAHGWNIELLEGTEGGTRVEITDV